jgi:hypothetical protein
MNLFLQEGVCNSPPFPKYESFCSSPDRPTLKEGYYYEMHNFEFIDYTRLHNKSSLVKEYEKRYSRIKNCSHNYDSLEMQIIMKSVENMTVSGGWK